MINRSSVKPSLALQPLVCLVATLSTCVVHAALTAGATSNTPGSPALFRPAAPVAAMRPSASIRTLMNPAPASLANLPNKTKTYGKQTFSDFSAKIAPPFARYKAITTELVQSKFKQFSGATPVLSAQTQERLEQKAFTLTGQRAVSYMVFNDNPALCAVMASGGAVKQQPNQFVLDYVLCDALNDSSEKSKQHRENLASGKPTGTDAILAETSAEDLAKRQEDLTRLRQFELRETQFRVFQ